MAGNGSWRKIDAAFHRPKTKYQTARPDSIANQPTEIQTRTLSRVIRPTPRKTPPGVTAKRRGRQSGELLRNRSADAE